MILNIVAGLISLRGDWARLRALCWSDNTIKTKKTQWRRFFKFCVEYDLPALPASVDVVCLYITHLTRTVSYSTITQYIGGVWSLHKYLGYPHPDPTTFLIHSTLQGAKRLLGAGTNPALPLSPENLVGIYKNLDLQKPADLKFWAALSLSFRCLLRVSHITNTQHELKTCDIIVTDSGMDVIMRSSKTIQFKERVNKIPVVSSPSVLCPVSVLQDYIASSKRKSTSPLFGYSYNAYNSRLKSECKDIGLVGHYSTHSVRRGAATYLSTFMPLHDVKTYGDWKSWAVLLYLADSYSTRQSKDVLVADNLANYN